MPPLQGATYRQGEIDPILRLQQMLELKAKGTSNGEIAYKLGVSREYVEQSIKDAIADQRAKVEDHVAEKFTIADMRLEALWRICQKHLDAMNESGAFDERIVRACILVMERQSRLWDLDRAKRGTKGAEPNRNLHDWLDNATWPELAEKARSYGLKVPEPFDANPDPSHSASV